MTTEFTLTGFIGRETLAGQCPGNSVLLGPIWLKQGPVQKGLWDKDEQMPAGGGRRGC